MVAWQRGDVRIVAMPRRQFPEGLIVEQFRLEENVRDTHTGVMTDMWSDITDEHEDAEYAVEVLCAEIILRNEVLPKWVREMAKDLIELAEMVDL